MNPHTYITSDPGDEQPGSHLYVSPYGMPPWLALLKPKGSDFRASDIVFADDDEEIDMCSECECEPAEENGMCDDCNVKYPQCPCGNVVSKRGKMCHECRD